MWSKIFEVLAYKYMSSYVCTHWLNQELSEKKSNVKDEKKWVQNWKFVNKIKVVWENW